MADLEAFRFTGSYCHYGVPYRKHTDIWTNAPITALRHCSADTPCQFLRTTGRHAENAGHGLHGTQTGMSGTRAGIVPRKLLLELLNSLVWGRSYAYLLSTESSDTEAAEDWG